MNTNPRISLFTALIILLSCSLPADSGQWKPVRPDKGGKRSVIVIGGNQWAYWLLKPGQEMTFNISEQDDYRVISRVTFDPSKNKEAIYTYRIHLKSDPKRLYSNAARVAKNVYPKGKKGKIHLGESRIREIDKRKGDDTMVVSLDKKAKYPVYFRIQTQREEYTPATNYIALTPSSYTEAVGTLTMEASATYYKVDHGKRLTVEVNGPTTLKILARVLMNDAMRGKIKFALAVFEDGNLKNTYSLESSSSKVTSVIGRKEVVPTKGENLYITVPEGRHRYNFDLPENGREVILRFFLPEKDLGRKAG